MGTRSTITFCEKINDEIQPLVSIYQQYDGYLEGVGKDLCTWLSKMTILNGYTLYDKYSDDVANGIGCLVAQYIRNIKPHIGDTYIIPMDSSQDGIDYNYKIIFDAYGKEPCNAAKVATVMVNNWGRDYFFIGTPKELLAYIDKQNEDK